MTLLFLPILSVTLTWLIWEAFCTYNVLTPMGYLPEGFHDGHSCGPGDSCPSADGEFERQSKTHRSLRDKVALIVLGLIFMGVLLSRFEV
ncbi:hypothetical protein [Phycicoccus sp. Soil803]|uniref:hypothetical protein n=1 Tax=Phycicoccus sp. Soil803 TaxID=1736415 RepID=UPI00070FC973|nr:hypothetical protein [Phycicoccus sp. Soil803]KRF24767.1 hypothetical protein ASG95_09810 [Phycicoccus sp. Soil803]